MWRAENMMSQISLGRSERRICMTVEEYQNKTFVDTGQTVDEDTSSFISVDSTYSTSQISSLLQNENPIYIPINGVNPKTKEENEVIMICRCNFKKWTKDFSCYARTDQISEDESGDADDSTDEDKFHDANEEIKAEEIWVYPRDELCKMIAESKGLQVNIPIPDSVTLDNDKKLGLLQAIKIECEGREARKSLLKEENDPIQELVIRLVSKFLSDKISNASDTVSYYTPKFLKSLGKNLFSGTSGLIAWIWRHPFWCVYISSATRCIRTMLCLWSNGVEWNLLKNIAYKMIERYAQPGTIFIEMCKSMINSFFCIASVAEKGVKGQVLSASYQAISECFKESIILVGRVGEYVMAIVDYIGVQISKKIEITNVWTLMIENMTPKKMSTFLELEKITRRIDEPKNILVETVVLNILLKKPMMIPNMVSMFTVAVPVPSVIQSVVEMSTSGQKTIKTIAEYTEKLAEVLTNARQFQQAIQALIDAISEIVSYIICNIKTYYNYPNDCCSDTSNLVKVLMNMQNPGNQSNKTWMEWWNNEGADRIEFNTKNDLYFVGYQP
jgi:rRNA-processing protein FCF1